MRIMIIRYTSYTMYNQRGKCTREVLYEDLVWAGEVAQLVAACTRVRHEEAIGGYFPTTHSGSPAEGYVEIIGYRFMQEVAPEEWREMRDPRPMSGSSVLGTRWRTPWVQRLANVPADNTAAA